MHRRGHYHLKARTGRRGRNARPATMKRAPGLSGDRGQSAKRKVKYLARIGYKHGDGEFVYAESGNMPGWATRGHTQISRTVALAYWQAADQYERCNGRLFKHLELALPLELSQVERLALAREFIEDVFARTGVRLPYTLTFHAGKPSPRSKRTVDNPHCDIVFSERIADGIDRTPETWFKRAAPRSKGRAFDPSRGGARKTEMLKPEAWLAWARRHWADLTNRYLADAGHEVRVDHRSLEAQGLPGTRPRHLGPRAAGYEARTGKKSRRREYIELAEALDDDVASARSDLVALEAELAAVEVDELDLELSSDAEDCERIVAEEEAKARWLREEQTRKDWQRAEEVRAKTIRLQTTDPGLLSRWAAEHDAMMSDWERHFRASPPARQWRVLPSAPAQALTFLHRSTEAVVVDYGPTFELSRGGTGCAELINSLVMAKLSSGHWSGPVIVTGPADFKGEYIRSAIKTGVDIQPKAGEDSELLARVREELQPSPPPIADPLARMREAWAHYTDSASSPRASPGAAPSTPGARKS